MSVNYKNPEGYSDPTAYEALVAIEKEVKKYRPLVYICSPYSGDVLDNTEKAIRYSRYAVDQGVIPLAPHLLLPRFMSDKKERELALFMGLVFLGKCEQIWVFGDKISKGMKKELDKAKRRRIPIHYYSEDLKEEQSWN